MTFIWPPLLLLLVLVPMLIGLYLWVQRRRRRIIARYGRSMFTPTISGRNYSLRRHIPPLFFLTALTILIIALARPEAVVGIPRIEGTVILAFDISGSMAADDLEPTRLEAAKAAAGNFVEKQPPTVSIGVVAFSDSGLVVQQPSYDQAEILTTINRLNPSLGTSLGNGILVSLTLIDHEDVATNFYSNQTPEPTPSPTPVPEGTYTTSVIVLLTDGENTDEPDPLEIAQTAADRGVRVYTIGIGSALGTILNIEGFSVFTQLDEPLLQTISGMTGGIYFNAESDEELFEIYENLDRQLVISPEPMEVTSLFAGLGIVALLLGGLLSLLWFGRVL